MAKITKNHLIKGARGKMGDQFVYKTRGGKTFIAELPEYDPNSTPTDSQLKTRDLFGSAAAYAKGAVENEQLKLQYERKAKKGATAYNMAFRDFLKKPSIKDLLTSRYNGSIGSLIRVKAKDDFRVAEVMVSIHNPEGELVEEGLANLDPINRDIWIYTATRLNATLTGSKISVVARDLPGNEAESSVIL